MNWVPLAVVCGLTITVCGIILQYLRRKGCNSSDIQIYLRPAERIRTFGGWASLELHLVNQSAFTLWLEDAKLVTTDLDANFQTAIAIGQVTHRIRQAVRPNETLSMSIIGSLYDAAGRPQGPYSFLVVGTVHYRIGEDWAQSNILPHRIEMAALSVRRLRRIRRESTSAESHDGHRIIGSSPIQKDSSKETSKVKAAGR
jgi:hypothetical protein